MTQDEIIGKLNEISKEINNLFTKIRKLQNDEEKLKSMLIHSLADFKYKIGNKYLYKRTYNDCGFTRGESAVVTVGDIELDTNKQVKVLLESEEGGYVIPYFYEDGTPILNEDIDESITLEEIV